MLFRSFLTAPKSNVFGYAYTQHAQAHACKLSQLFRQPSVSLASHSAVPKKGEGPMTPGGKAWGSLQFLQKLCSILSSICDRAKARSLVVGLKENLPLRGRVTIADFRDAGVKHIYALCNRTAYEPLWESEDSFSNDMSSSSRRSCLPRGFHIGFQNTLPEAWYGNGNGEPY